MKAKRKKRTFCSFHFFFCRARRQHWKEAFHSKWNESNADGQQFLARALWHGQGEVGYPGGRRRSWHKRSCSQVPWCVTCLAGHQDMGHAMKAWAGSPGGVQGSIIRQAGPGWGGGAVMDVLCTASSASAPHETRLMETASLPSALWRCWCVDWENREEKYSAEVSDKTWIWWCLRRKVMLLLKWAESWFKNRIILLLHFWWH